ncbi:MAG: paraquat-inducible protein A [Campylobacterota bacterium]|nr:paraquat-inducible protein A [Campylobacterota bacterium]
MMSFIKKIFQQLLLLLSIAVLSFMIYTVVNLLETGEKAKTLKEDYAQLHSVEFGLFNSSVWIEKISNIVDQKIDEFDFTESSRAEIKTYIETILDTLIVEADRSVRERNKNKSGFFDSLLGDTKQLVTDSLLDIKDLRKRVPEFTDTILNELERPNNQKILKKVMRDKLKSFTQNNLSPTDISNYNAILKRYNTESFEACTIVLDGILAKTTQDMDNDAIMILSLATFLIFIILLQGSILRSITLFLLTVTSITLLIPGLFLPMIDIEAKIAKFHFTILEKHIIFTDQILFFQTKSISDLVRLLLEYDEAKMIFVGVLLTLFSVIFPFLKLVSTYLYFYSRSFIGNNATVRFFALKSTKWSMADVMVVSIFMAYLGLDGIVDHELEALESRNIPINIITTNDTQLNVGFFLFLGFVFSSFALSILVERSRKKS